MEIVDVAQDFLLVLIAGTVAGIICKRLGASLLVAYLLVGALIGPGGGGLVVDAKHELHLLAEAGALFLLFSVGIEFSFDELAHLRRYILIGGAIQMFLASVPLALAAWLFGMSPQGAILAGAAGALSSTVLVFRALTEEGQTESPHGRRGIAVLLFQDAALVPLLLLVPLLTGQGAPSAPSAYLLLAAKAAAFLGGVWLLHQLVVRFVLPLVAALRSVELIVLLALALLGSVCWTAYEIGLPLAIGAFATGIALSGNRLSKQIDTILLPFRETFAAVFFVTLGMLLRPASFFSEPLLLAVGFAAIIALKSLSAAIALRVVGLPWRAAAGMGLGLSQLGEFSFLLVSRGVDEKLIDAENYNRMLFVAIATLIATPWLLRHGLQWASQSPIDEQSTSRMSRSEAVRAMVIGAGPVGGQIASRFETAGVDVAMIDLSPVNLHPFAQQGFVTFAGDARHPDVLARAGVRHCQLAVVCVPKDDIAMEIARSVRQANDRIIIVVRCRYQSSAVKLRKAGADSIVSEEREAAGPLWQRCEEQLHAVQG